jgi:hypothetical protein
MPSKLLPLGVAGLACTPVVAADLTLHSLKRQDLERYKAFVVPASAQMHAYDVSFDGLTDVT